MWLNLHLRGRLEQNIFAKTFPGNQPDVVQIVRHRRMNFGEAVSAFPGHKRTPSRIEDHFRSFYLGFNSNSFIQFAYKDDEPHFETTFNFGDIHKDVEDWIAFVEIIKPGLLPSCIFGKDQSTTYKFYKPLVCARQLGLANYRLAFISLL
jgi:hypothetical protein